MKYNIAILVTLLVFSCGQTSEKSSEASNTEAETPKNPSVIEEYMSLKDALVKTDAEAAAKAAKNASDKGEL